MTQKNRFQSFAFNKKNGAVIAVISGIVFFVIANFYLNYLEQTAVSVLYSIIFALMVFAVFSLDLIKSKEVLTVVLIVAFFAVFIRLINVDMESHDYNHAISMWIENFKQTGTAGFTNLAAVNNYSFPYMYFCYIISLIPIETIAVVKFVSILFDIGCAFFAVKICSVFNQSKAKQLAVYFGVLLLPTVVMNSAWWGQCDSIYTMFCLGALYFTIKNDMSKTAVFAAVAVSFKLQAAFFLPFMAILLFAGRFKIKHCVLFLASYIGMSVPAFFVGAPFSSLYTVYFNQASEIASLNRNSASIFAFAPYGAAKGLNPNDNELFIWEYAALFEALGFAITFLLVVCLIVIGIRLNKRLSNKVIVIMAFLFSAGIPFFLPYMHDRYFFSAEILAVVLAFCFGKFATVPLLLQFAAFTPYNIYLVIGMPLVPLELCAIAVFLSLCFAAFELVSEIKLVTAKTA